MKPHHLLGCALAFSAMLAYGATPSLKGLSLGMTEQAARAAYPSLKCEDRHPLNDAVVVRQCHLPPITIATIPATYRSVRFKDNKLLDLQFMIDGEATDSLLSALKIKFGPPTRVTSNGPQWDFPHGAWLSVFITSSITSLSLSSAAAGDLAKAIIEHKAAAGASDL